MGWIPNLDKKLVPILLGISLTTLSCVSLAIFFKSKFEKDDEEKNDNDTKNIQKSHQIVRSKSTTVQFKVPKKFVSAIIGRNGSIIKDIQDKTGTHVNICDDNIESLDCLCIIRGNEIESIRLAESIIKNIIDNQPIINTYDMFVPYESWRRYVISHRGSVRDIQSNTGVKIIIESGSHKFETGLKRKLILKGSDYQIALAEHYIKHILRIEENEEICPELENNYKKTEDSFFNNNIVKDIGDNKSIEIDIRVHYEAYRAILGMDWDILKQIQNSSGAKIKLDNDDYWLPSYKYKKLFISGTADNIAAAISQIYHRSDEILKFRRYLQQEFSAFGSIMSHRVKSITEGQPISKVYEMIVSYETYEKILEKSQELQRSCDAEIIIDNDTYVKMLKGVKKQITIKGTNDQIITAIRQMADKFPDEIGVPTLVKYDEEITDVQDIKIYEMFVPLASCKKFTNNKLIQLQLFSNALILMESSHKSENEKKIEITGNIDQIAQAFIRIKDIIIEEYKCQKELEHKTMEIKTKMLDFQQFFDHYNVDRLNNASMFSKISLKDDLIEVLVSATKTPNQFWIHMVGSGNDALNNLILEMTEFYNKEENRQILVLKKILPSQMVAVRRNDKWYRAKVMSMVDADECEVFFVDYGGSEKISVNNILELLTNMLSLRVQAVECSLANVKPRESEWSFDACLKFDELVHVTRRKSLFAKIRSYKRYPDRYGAFNREAVIPCFDLYDKIDDKYINIGEALVSLGFAQYEEKAANLTSSCDEQSLGKGIMNNQSCS